MRGQPTPAYGYNLETGEYKMWRTMTDAAEYIGTKSQYLAVLVKEHRPYKGWCVAQDPQTARLMYESKGKLHIAKAKPSGKLMQLRIDAHTVIWVHEEEANEAFAKRYKRKLERDNGIDQ